MKCATVTIGGNNKNTEGFEALPTMFRANIKISGKRCIVPEGTKAIKFKNPGFDVVGTGIEESRCDNTKPGISRKNDSPFAENSESINKRGINFSA
jgi:hypothetical protein